MPTVGAAGPDGQTCGGAGWQSEADVCRDSVGVSGSENDKGGIIGGVGQVTEIDVRVCAIPSLV